MADQGSTTGIQITSHSGGRWFQSVLKCTFFKWSKSAITEQINFISIDETVARETIEKLKMVKYLSSDQIEFWGDREVLRVDRITKATIANLKKKEVPHG